MPGYRLISRALQRAGLPLLLAVAAMAITAGGAGAASGVSPHDKPKGALVSLCAPAIADVEDRLGLPAQLLSAIALAESGRWDAVSRKSISWPWAVYAEGRPHFPPDKQSAIALVREVMARGVRNIDVGCMQINLFYHPDAFDSLDEAFDPAANAAYAGDLLRRLQNTHKSWSRAIAFYHSATLKYAMPYLRKVQRLWLVERRREAVLLRDARIEVLRMKKAAREANQAANGKTATF